MTVLSDAIIGDVNFETFAQLVEERIKQMDEESAAASDIVENSAGNNTQAQAARMRLARLHIETASLLRMMDVSAIVFRIVTKLDHMVGKRSTASKRLLVRLFEDSRSKLQWAALSVSQLEAIERYFDFTVEQLKRQKRDITVEEKAAVEAAVIAMIK